MAHLLRVRSIGWLVVVLVAAAGTARAGATGSITLTLAPMQDRRVVKAVAIDRSPQILTTSKGVKRDIGMGSRTYPGAVAKGVIRFAHLPLTGRYDLKLTFDNGAVLAGWDATVPPSAYVGDPPLRPVDRAAIEKKLANDQFTAFSDEVRVLDITGNADHASVLVMKLRKRPTVGGPKGAKPWIFRIERWAWYTGDGPTWTPWFKRPFYALTRERIRPQAFRSLRLGYVRSLGGIALARQKPAVRIGPVTIGVIPQGVHALDANGRVVVPVPLKGPDPTDVNPAPDRSQSKGADHAP